jgi:hypothetical protein
LFVVAVRALAHGTVDTRTNPTQGLELPAHSHGLTGITADADQKTASQFPGISSDESYAKSNAVVRTPAWILNGFAQLDDHDVFSRQRCRLDPHTLPVV